MCHHSCCIDVNANRARERLSPERIEVCRCVFHTLTFGGFHDNIFRKTQPRNMTPLHSSVESTACAIFRAVHTRRWHRRVALRLLAHVPSFTLYIFQCQQSEGTAEPRKDRSRSVGGWWVGVRHGRLDNWGGCGRGS